MRNTVPRPILLLQLVAGLMDSTTGILLVAAPLFTLRLMRIESIPPSGSFVAFVGAFVLGVGLTYLWVLVRYTRGLTTAADWEAQWRDTAIIRAVVAVGLLIQILEGRMGIAWISVVATDGGLAILQALGLWRRWLHPVERARLG